MKDKRKLILKVAAKIISEKGYSQTTIDEITKKSGIGKGTFYIYFKDKNALFFSIVEEDINNLLDEIKKTVEKIDDFFEKLKKIIRMYLAYHERNYFLFKILIQEKPFLKRSDFAKFWEDFFSKWDFIEGDILNQIRKNRIKKIEPPDIIYSLLGILHGNIHRWILSERKYSLIKKTNIIYQTLVSGIMK